MATSRQVKSPLLCADCESILNRQGENWILPLLATVEGRFELYESVTVVPPVLKSAEAAVYSCNGTPAVRVHSLTHFALGIFWKASVHSWLASEVDPHIELGPYSELVRRFLLGGQFPNNMTLAVTLLPPPAPVFFNMPETTSGLTPRVHWFYVPGVVFTLTVGKQLEEYNRRTCIYSHFEHPILVGGLSELIKRRVMGVASTAKRSKKLLEREKH